MRMQALLERTESFAQRAVEQLDKKDKSEIAGLIRDLAKASTIVRERFEADETE